MTFPIAAVAWSAVGAAALFRVFYRPARALVADGYVARCAGGAPCSDSMVVDSFVGKAPVYALASGQVFRVTDNAVFLACRDEPVVLVYLGTPSKGGMSIQVKPGQDVGIGQQVGLAERVELAVYALDRAADGKVTPRPIEPASWLATHGLKISVKARPGAEAGALWCEGGRKLSVPQDVAGCGIKLATPGAFMLLPVSATME